MTPQSPTHGLVSQYFRSAYQAYSKCPVRVALEKRAINFLLILLWAGLGEAMW